MDYTKEIAFCREKVSPDLSSMHYALLFQKEEDQAFWLGCATLLHEIKRATLQQLEAGLTQVKLGWWQTALAGSKQGKAQHPVILAIGQSVVNQVSDEQWAELINLGVDSCEPQRYDNLTMWTSHLKELALPWATVLDARFGANQGDAILDFWVHCTQLTQLLRLAKYVDQNFQPLPIDELAKHKVTVDSLRRRVHDEDTAQLIDSISRQVIVKADARWKALPATTRLAIRPMRALYRMRLAELKQHKKEGFKHFLTEQKQLTPGKKFWLSWGAQVLRL